MRYVQAVIAMGLFGWLGVAVITDSLPGGDGGSGKTRALRSSVDLVTSQFGTFQTGIGLIVLGLVLALFFVWRDSSE